MLRYDNATVNNLVPYFIQYGSVEVLDFLRLKKEVLSEF